MSTPSGILNRISASLIVSSRSITLVYRTYQSLLVSAPTTIDSGSSSEKYNACFRSRLGDAPFGSRGRMDPSARRIPRRMTRTLDRASWGSPRAEASERGPVGRREDD